MALYHTHRPQNFDAVIGQNHIVETIQNQILKDKIAHAYLFSGPRGVGKTTTARILAKAVNVPLKKGTAEPNNTDPIAIEINEGRCIDVIEIDAASHTGVDNVRQNIIENAQFKPTKCNKKVFIIDEVHMLSTPAFNALLKTLEEPPEHVLFILATTELHKLPVTIVSRCQRFEFKRVQQDVIVEHLKFIAKAENVELEESILKRIAKKSDGCVRDSISLLDQIMSSGAKKIALTDVEFILPTTHSEIQLGFLQSLVDKNAADAFSKLHSLVDQGIHIDVFAADLIEITRSVMVYKVDPSILERELDLGTELETQFKAIAETISSQDIVRLLDNMLARKSQIKASPRTELPLEMLIIEWTGVGPTENKPTPSIKAAQTTPPQPVQATPAPAPKPEPVATTEQEQTPTPPPAPEPKIQEPAASAPAADVDFEVIKTKWSSVLSTINSEYPSLGFIFKTVSLAGVTGSVLNLDVQYPFHKEKLSETDCQQKIVKIIADVTGMKVAINLLLKEADEAPEQNNELNELASAFGGEVV